MTDIILWFVAPIFYLLVGCYIADIYTLRFPNERLKARWGEELGREAQGYGVLFVYFAITFILFILWGRA